MDSQKVVVEGTSPKNGQGTKLETLKNGQFKKYGKCGKL